MLTGLHGKPYNIRVNMLRQSTDRIAASFDGMKGGATPDEIRKWLDDIYKLRTGTERFLDDEIGA
jgi:hypothetical protein